MIGGRGGGAGHPIAIAAMLAFAACATAPGRGDQPAALTSPTPASRAELARVVAGALHGAPVTLADDALTRDGTLIIERAPARTREGVPLLGRETGRPEHFRLLKRGSRCVLVHEGTGRRWTLKEATCAPLVPAPPDIQGIRPPAASPGA
jgi:hypothetical protein